ncbi:MAG: DNA-directed RNA polymerase subunit A'' [Halobacteria archaeon]|nr:DNA-directed RNA polymerase subunit A'' [Halobacteria archaeon]
MSVEPETVESKLDESELPERLHEKVKDAVGKEDVTEEQIDEIIAQTEERYRSTRIDPLEPVGTVSAQSIGEPGTQMSLDADEEVIVRRGGKTEMGRIGEIVDGVFENASETVEVDGHEAVGVTGLEVLSLRDDEKTQWKPVEEVSRHESPDELLHIQLEDGRDIRATKSHSFVTREDNGVVPVAGDELKEGDWIPVVGDFGSSDETDTVRILRYLPDDGYWSTDAAADGGAVTEEQAKNRLDALEDGRLDDGVYPVGGTVSLPRHLPADSETGFFFGAYLAEGYATDSYVSISNIDDGFLDRLRGFAERYDLTTHEYENGEFAEGRDLRLNGKIVADLLRQTCGDETKRVPGFAFGSSDDFARGLLRGYLSGDGSVSDGTVRASSTDEKLIEDIALLLSRFGVHATLGETRDSYTLRVPRSHLGRFAERVGLVGERKEALDEAVATLDEDVPDVVDQIPEFGDALEEVAAGVGAPSREFNSAVKRGRIGRRRLERLVERADESGVDSDSVEDLRSAVESEVVWKRIESVEAVEPTHDYVYDFSVAGLDTFTTSQGVVTHNTMNTFHYAGVAEIDVTQGLPRLIELVDARKEPDTPMMTVYLKDDWATDREKAREVVWDIESTTILSLGDISTNVAEMEVSINLDEEMLDERLLSVDDIADKIESNLGVDVRANGTRVSFGPSSPSYRELLQLIEELREITFKGIEEIDRVVIRKEDVGDREEYVLYTEGSALKDVIQVEGVDETRTRTNNIHEMADVFGIEAARNSLIDEMTSTLEEQGLEVDIRHEMLVADIMTVTGEIRSIGRHGISGAKESVLSRAAFEVTVNQLLDAAVHGEIDDLDGVIENVIVGQPIKLGTGDVDLVMGRPED